MSGLHSLSPNQELPLTWHVPSLSLPKNSYPSTSGAGNHAMPCLHYLLSMASNAVKSDQTSEKVSNAVKSNKTSD
jgi:hypothetical protein